MSQRLLAKLNAKNVGSILLTTMKYYFVFHVTNKYFIPLELVICKGNSMEPTLFNNDILIAEKVSVRRQNIRRNDLVICKHPFITNKTICKRISDTFYDFIHDANESKLNENSELVGFHDRFRAKIINNSFIKAYLSLIKKAQKWVCADKRRQQVGISR